MLENKQEDGFLPVREVMAFNRVSRSYVYARIQRGQLETLRVKGRLYIKWVPTGKRGHRRGSNGLVIPRKWFFHVTEFGETLRGMWVTPRDAELGFGLSRSYITILLNRGDLKGRRVGKRWLLDVDALIRLFQEEDL